MISDFSHILEPGMHRQKLQEYYASICAPCGGLCCAFNSSPVSSEVSLKVNLLDEYLVILAKALALHQRFRVRFVQNMRLLLARFRQAGFEAEEGEMERDPLHSAVQALFDVAVQIEDYNRKTREEGGKPYSHCLFLNPDRGCIMEEYRPYHCITAFRNCFAGLDLHLFINGAIRQATGVSLLAYTSASLAMGRRGVLPMVLIGADRQTRRGMEELFSQRSLPAAGRLSHHQLALLADFITYPFTEMPRELKGVIGEDGFYFMGRVKDPPPVVFVEEIYPGPAPDDFRFGLDYVQCFRVSSVVDG